MRRALGALRARWERAGRHERVALGGLAVLLAAGLTLRLLWMLAYRPALIGYPDTAVYVSGAQTELFADRFRVVGYSAFLRLLHDINPNLSLTTLVQHGLGVATALLVYATVRRAGGPPWLGLVPAAVVLIGGDQLMFEHALVSESLYTFLTACALYAAVRSIGSARLWTWPLAGGALMGLAASVRLAGLVLVPLVVAWMVLVPAARRRERVLRAAAAAAGGAVVLSGYLIAARVETDRWTFTRTGAYNFYGRVATFADCREFDEPAGTEALCEQSPPHERQSAQAYVFLGPAVQLFGEPQVGSPTRENVELLSTWSRRAARAQPLDWADASLRDFARYVSPDAFERPQRTPEARDYANLFVDPSWVPRNAQIVNGYYTSDGIFQRSGLFDALRDYEDATALEGPPMAVLLLLALLGPVLLQGRERRVALLLGGAALATLAVPAVTFNYDGRLGVPAYGPLAAAAALGGLGLARMARTRMPSSRT